MPLLTELVGSIDLRDYKDDAPTGLAWSDSPFERLVLAIILDENPLLGFHENMAKRAMEDHVCYQSDASSQMITNGYAK